MIPRIILDSRELRSPVAKERNLADGEKSYFCQEDSRFPSTDNYLYFPTNIVSCQEGAEMIERICLCCNKVFFTQECYLKRGGGKYCSRKCGAEIAKGKTPWNKGLKGFLAGEKHPMFGKNHTEEARKKMSVARKGRTPWNKGKHHSEETKRKMSVAFKGEGGSFFGRHHTEEAKLKNALAHIGRVTSESTKKKLSDALKGRKRPDYVVKKIATVNRGKKRSELARKNISDACLGRIPWDKGIIRENMRGEKHSGWKGGERLAQARSGNKRRKRGFVLLTKHNPYDEPIDYHHIHPNLPYIIPCPKRIHKMFNGHEKNHFNNVNAMLGFRFEGE